MRIMCVCMYSFVRYFFSLFNVQEFIYLLLYCLLIKYNSKIPPLPLTFPNLEENGGLLPIWGKIGEFPEAP